jgi:DNA-binding transcriptional ArsR family regulator
MGAGLALEFRLRIPDMYVQYKERCAKGEIRIGQYWIYDQPNRTGKRILNFPVKKGFNHPSKWEYVIDGLSYLVRNYKKDNITSIAMPTLGSRLGKLDDQGVVILMEEELQRLPINIEIYRTYEQDTLTKLVKRLIEQMTISEISKAFELSQEKSEKLKGCVAEAFLLSHLLTFHKLNIRLVQMLYDFGFNQLANRRLTGYLGGKF